MRKKMTRGGKKKMMNNIRSLKKNIVYEPNQRPSRKDNPYFAARSCQVTKKKKRRQPMPLTQDPHVKMISIVRHPTYLRRCGCSRNTKNRTKFSLRLYCRRCRITYISNIVLKMQNYPTRSREQVATHFHCMYICDFIGVVTSQDTAHIAVGLLYHCNHGNARRPYCAMVVALR